MSDPTTTYEEPLRGVQLELVSAMSALNMHPEPLPKDKWPKGNRGFLSEVDGWAAHAMEHLRAASELCIKAEQERDRLNTQIYRLRVELAELRRRVSKDV